MYEGKVVWITGASSGIGAAFAEAFHANGAKVILSALSKKELKPITSKLEGSAALPFDVAEFDKLPKITADAVDCFGKIDILVNNAGISQRALAQDTSFDVYRRLIDVDLMAPIALTQLVLPYMKRQGTGRIIAMASIAGKFGFPLRTAYCAAKHGVFGYFDALRSEIADQDIEVHVIAPGAVKTNLSQNAVVGDGTTYGKLDPALEAGYDPAWLVDHVLKKIKSGKREIVVARGIEAIAYRLRRFFPEAAFEKVAKSAPEIIRQVQKSSSQ